MRQSEGFLHSTPVRGNHTTINYDNHDERPREGGHNAHPASSAAEGLQNRRRLNDVYRQQVQPDFSANANYPGRTDTGPRFRVQEERQREVPLRPMYVENYARTPSRKRTMPLIYTTPSLTQNRHDYLGNFSNVSRENGRGACVPYTSDRPYAAAEHQLQGDLPRLASLPLFADVHNVQNENGNSFGEVGGQGNMFDIYPEQTGMPKPSFLLAPSSSEDTIIFPAVSRIEPISTLANLPKPSFLLAPSSSEDTIIFPAVSRIEPISTLANLPKPSFLLAPSSSEDTINFPAPTRMEPNSTLANFKLGESFSSENLPKPNVSSSTSAEDYSSNNLTSSSSKLFQLPKSIEKKSFLTASTLGNPTSTQSFLPSTLLKEEYRIRNKSGNGETPQPVLPSTLLTAENISGKTHKNTENRNLYIPENMETTQNYLPSDLYMEENENSNPHGTSQSAVPSTLLKPDFRNLNSHENVETSQSVLQSTLLKPDFRNLNTHEDVETLQSVLPSTLLKPEFRNLNNHENVETSQSVLPSTLLRPEFRNLNGSVEPSLPFLPSTLLKEDYQIQRTNGNENSVPFPALEPTGESVTEDRSPISKNDNVGHTSVNSNTVCRSVNNVSFNTDGNFGTKVQNKLFSSLKVSQHG